MNLGRIWLFSFLRINSIFSHLKLLNLTVYYFRKLSNFLRSHFHITLFAVDILSNINLVNITWTSAFFPLYILLVAFIITQFNLELYVFLCLLLCILPFNGYILCFVLSWLHHCILLLLLHSRCLTHRLNFILDFIVSHILLSYTTYIIIRMQYVIEKKHCGIRYSRRFLMWRPFKAFTL